jgi:signal transduction histidine kinase
MVKKGLIIGWLMVAYCFSLKAQIANSKMMDSVLDLAFKKNPDTSSIKAFSELQRHYFNRGQYDSALFYSRISLPIAEKVGTKMQLARIYYNAGLIYTNLTIYDSAIFYLNDAGKRALAIPDSNLLANVLNANALLSNYQSDYRGAVEFLTRAAAMIESSKNIELRNWLPQLYGNIGHNLIAEKQLQKGIEYEKRALQFSNFPDEKRFRVMIHLDIADAYIKLDDPGEAKTYLDSARIIGSTLNNTVLQTLLMNTEGVYYAKMKDYNGSLKSYLAAYAIADSTGNTFMKGECADNVAKAYLISEDLLSAQKYAVIANDIAALSGNYSMRASSYETLKEVAQGKNDFKQAFRFGELQKLYADSATNTASQKSSLYLEARYQNVKKEKDIADLTLSNTTKDLEVFQRNKILMTGGITAAALLLLMGLLYRQSSQKRVIAEKDVMLQQEQVKFLERQQQVVSLQSMVNGQETERTRIAKDLHDGLGGLFSTIKMYFSTLQHEQPQLKEDSLFIKSYDMVNTASEEVRRIAHNMMPEVLIKIGLIQAVQELCNSISAGKLLNVTLQTYGMGKRLNGSTEVMLFRIIQELLNNIIKHAKATEAIIQFNKDENRLSIVVEDNGHGFNTAEKDEKAKAGLVSVESRVTYLNGKLSIDSQKETGTTVMMDFLLNEIDL